MKYKSVLFDMDGTVLDTLDDLCNAVNHTLSYYGYPVISKFQCAQNLGNGARYLIEKSAPEGVEIDQMLKDYMQYYNEHCLVDTAPYSGILELMNRLKENGVKMAIISNKPDKATKELSRKFFSDIVDFAVGESETVKRKPNPDAVLAAADYFGLKKEECVYIGDTEVDVQTGINAGIDVIAVLWGFRTKEQLMKSGATVFANSSDELLELLT